MVGLELLSQTDNFSNDLSTRLRLYSFLRSSITNMVAELALSCNPVILLIRLMSRRLGYRPVMVLTSFRTRLCFSVSTLPMTSMR